MPWRYGVDPQSMLLRNDGRGHFTDVTAKLAPELEHVGMVDRRRLARRRRRRSARPRRRRRVDADHRLPQRGRRTGSSGSTVPGLEKSDGWWNRIVAGDFTGDGRVDFIVGNLGLNGRLHATPTRAGDDVREGLRRQRLRRADHLDATTSGVSYPLPLARRPAAQRCRISRARFPTYKRRTRGRRSTDVFTPQELSDAVLKQAYTFATSLVRNNGDGSFTLVPLPDEAQLAPVYGMLAGDVDGDGHIDLLLAGNFDGVQAGDRPHGGELRARSSRGDGSGHFTPVRAPESGFFVPGQARDIARVRTARGDVYRRRAKQRPAAPLPRESPVGGSVQTPLSATTRAGY